MLSFINHQYKIIVICPANILVTCQSHVSHMTYLISKPKWMVTWEKLGAEDLSFAFMVLLLLITNEAWCRRGEFLLVGRLDLRPTSISGSASHAHICILSSQCSYTCSSVQYITSFMHHSDLTLHHCLIRPDVGVWKGRFWTPTHLKPLTAPPRPRLRKITWGELSRPSFYKRFFYNNWASCKQLGHQWVSHNQASYKRISRPSLQPGHNWALKTNFFIPYYFSAYWEAPV